MSNSTAIPTIGLVRLPHAADLPLPSYETSGAAGMDIRAAAPEDQPIVLKAGERALISTGFVFEIPEGFEVQVRPRSGLALKHGVTCLNSPGTIDADYRGELKVLLINHGDAPFVVERGTRIAQLVVAPVVRPTLVAVASLDDTVRGLAGFGSTGR